MISALINTCNEAHHLPDCLASVRQVADEVRLAAIAAASGDWLFVFDPDMRLPAATAQRLRAVVANDEADIVDFHCANYYFGHLCRRGHGSQGVYRKFFKRAVFQPVS
ncbi:MAG: hypothetical protein N3A66_11580, partial [Planctomycetota bacterium]|nr:hypothetical protein [Planctomycetota bacterium]